MTLAEAEARPLELRVAPTLIGEKAVLIRDDDESDDEYAARVKSFAALMQVVGNATHWRR
jgi:hypothetical protein